MWSNSQRLKPIFIKKMINIIKPRVEGLFQTIQWLVLSTNNTIIFHKTRRFVHVYFFRKVSIKEGTFSSKSRMKGEDCMNWVHFCNKGKGFSVVDSFLLPKSLGYHPIIVTFISTIEYQLGILYPSTLNNTLFLVGKLVPKSYYSQTNQF